MCNPEQEEKYINNNLGIVYLSVGDFFMFTPGNPNANNNQNSETRQESVQTFVEREFEPSFETVRQAEPEQVREPYTKDQIIEMAKAQTGKEWKITSMPSSEHYGRYDENAHDVFFNSVKEANPNEKNPEAFIQEQAGQEGSLRDFNKRDPNPTSAAELNTYLDNLRDNNISFKYDERLQSMSVAVRVGEVVMYYILEEDVKLKETKSFNTEDDDGPEAEEYALSAANGNGIWWGGKKDQKADVFNRQKELVVKQSIDLTGFLKLGSLRSNLDQKKEVETTSHFRVATSLLSLEYFNLNQHQEDRETEVQERPLFGQGEEGLKEFSMNHNENLGIKSLQKTTTETAQSARPLIRVATQNEGGILNPFVTAKEIIPKKTNEQVPSKNIELPDENLGSKLVDDEVQEEVIEEENAEEIFEEKTEQSEVDFDTDEVEVSQALKEVVQSKQVIARKVEIPVVINKAEKSAKVENTKPVIRISKEKNSLNTIEEVQAPIIAKSDKFQSVKVETLRNNHKMDIVQPKIRQDENLVDNILTTDKEAGFVIPVQVVVPSEMTKESADKITVKQEDKTEDQLLDSPIWVNKGRAVNEVANQDAVLLHEIIASKKQEDKDSSEELDIDPIESTLISVKQTQSADLNESDRLTESLVVSEVINTTTVPEIISIHARPPEDGEKNSLQAVKSSSVEGSVEVVATQTEAMPEGEGIQIPEIKVSKPILIEKQTVTAEVEAVYKTEVGFNEIHLPALRTIKEPRAVVTQESVQKPSVENDILDKLEAEAETLELAKPQASIDSTIRQLEIFESTDVETDERISSSFDDIAVIPELLVDKEIDLEVSTGFKVIPIEQRSMPKQEKSLNVALARTEIPTVLKIDLTKFVKPDHTPQIDKVFAGVPIIGEEIESVFASVASNERKIIDVSKFLYKENTAKARVEKKFEPGYNHLVKKNTFAKLDSSTSDIAIEQQLLQIQTDSTNQLLSVTL